MDKAKASNERNKKVLILIMGRSGAGITSAVKALQDFGLFVVDNLPLKMIVPTVDALVDDKKLKKYDGYAVGIHGYSVPDLASLNSVKQKLSDKFLIDVIFLKAKADVLARRFSTSRRPHPLGGILKSAIKKEMEFLVDLESSADLVLNTTEISPHVLARYLEARYSNHIPKRKLLVVISSFGFKHKEAPVFDLVFDVRFLRNPYFVDGLKERNGLDDKVYDYVRGDERYDEFKTKITDLLDFVLVQYFNEGKTYLRIGIGCTGGKHRSVTFVRDLQRHIEDNKFSFVHLATEHTDIGKN